MTSVCIVTDMCREILRDVELKGVKAYSLLVIFQHSKYFIGSTLEDILRLVTKLLSDERQNCLICSSCFLSARTVS